MRFLPLVALFLTTAAVTAAPALAEKPKWEYAEVTFRTVPARPGGVDADGNQVAATPSSMTIRWLSVAGEVEAKSWAELAEKLKATTFKKDGSLPLQKLQILNAFGADGWELMDQQTGTTTTAFGGPGSGERGTRTSTATGSWLFKRRMP